MKGKGPVILILITLLLVLLIAGVSFLPKMVVVESQVKITASAGEIRTFLAYPKNWDLWFFSPEDVDRKYMTMGKERGVGAGLKWFSEREGDGALEIKYLEKERVNYDLISDNNQFRSKGGFSMVEDRDTILLTWHDTLDLSTSLLARWNAKDSALVQHLSVQNTALLNRLRSAIHAEYRRQN